MERPSNEDTYYPLIEDEDFNIKIQNHPEFQKYFYLKDSFVLDEMRKRSEEKCNGAGGYIYKNIQLLVSSFLSLNTPYNGLLLYHGVGVGKSCSSILIADNFKDYVKKHNKKIIILTKKTIQDSFRREIFNTKVEKNKIDKNQFSCTSSEYSEKWNNFNEDNSDENDSNYNKNMKIFQSGLVDEYYEIYGYTEFANKYELIIKKDEVYNTEVINRLFSNTVIIIDEVHNLRDIVNEETGISSNENKKSKELIENIIKNLREPIKLALLSATPLYDRYEEMEFIINLLLMNDKKEKLEAKIIDNYIKNQDTESLNTIIEKTRGYVSYIKGNDPTIFPLILYPENNIKLSFETKEGTISSNKRINAVLCKMSSYQSDLYKLQDNKDMKKKYSNIVFPINNDTPTTFEDLFTTNDNGKTFSYKNQELGEEVLKNISKYSIKISNIIENIQGKGKIFIYSNYIKGNYGGNEFLTIILEYYGYIRKVAKSGKIEINPIFPSFKKNDIKGYYFVTDGSVSEEMFTLYKTEFNKDNNILGDKIKIIIGTTNMIEGVSLYNMRQIHILEPWYNISRNEQIVGRGVRQCSHINLPFEERNVTIFNYVAITDDLESDSITYKVPYKEKNQDSDLRKLELATEKINKIELLENIMKNNSIDCVLNKNVNSLIIDESQAKQNEVIEFKDSYNKSRLISYINNETNDCINSNKLEVIENKFHDLQTKIFINKNIIKNTKFFIKKIFTKGLLRNIDNTIKETNKIYYSYSDLLEELKKYNTEIDENIFKLSLQELILNKEIFYNKFNKSGYIVMKGIYFIFKNNEFENVEIPYEFNVYPFHTKINNLKSYYNYSVDTNINKSIVIKPQLTSVSDTPPESSTVKPDTTSSISKKENTDTGKDDEKTVSKDDEKTVSKDDEKIDYKKLTQRQSVEELLSECSKLGLVNSLNSLDNNRIIDIYNRLWSISLTPSTAKKANSLLPYIKNHNLELLKEEKKAKLYSSIFKLLFKVEQRNVVIDNVLFERFYNNYYYIQFIFNYSEIVLIYLKCLFYRKHIKKSEFEPKEEVIYNMYSNLLVSEQPLIFRYIDYSRDSLGNYTYDYIDIIYYEYDEENEMWVLHTESKKEQGIEIFRVFVKQKEKRNPNLNKKEFVKNLLKMENDDFNKIYNTFNYNNYNSINNGYFKYKGNPNNPFVEIDTPSEKIFNIIGCVNFVLSNSTSSVNKLSRNMFVLTLIYSKIKDDKNYYSKTSVHTDFSIFISEKKKIGLTKLKHIVYCLLDQIEEFNFKLLLETILIDIKESIDELWDSQTNFKYEILNILNDVNMKNPAITIEQYNLLQKYLGSLNKIDLDNIVLDTSLETINANLTKYKYKLYFYIDSIYNILTHNLSENTLILLLIYTLYDLNNYYHDDSYKHFYNKRWLLSLYESSLLNAAILDLKLYHSKEISTSETNRSADSAAFTQNILLQSKKPQSIDKFISADK